jgi:hypothetical protein
MHQALVCLIPPTLGIWTFYELAFGLPLALFHGALPDEKKHPYGKDTPMGP